MRAVIFPATGPSFVAGALDAPIRLTPAIMVTYTRWPPALFVLACLLAYGLGMGFLVYRLAELHVYAPNWADRRTFPLAFGRHMTVKFKILTSDNLEEVLYASTRVPLLSTASRRGCDGGLMFYYCNGEPRKHCRITILSDTRTPTRALLDSSSVDDRVAVDFAPSRARVLDWFLPWYCAFPGWRRRKWRSV